MTRALTAPFFAAAVVFVGLAASCKPAAPAGTAATPPLPIVGEPPPPQGDRARYLARRIDEVRVLHGELNAALEALRQERARAQHVDAALKEVQDRVGPDAVAQALRKTGASKARMDLLARAKALDEKAAAALRPEPPEATTTDPHDEVARYESELREHQRAAQATLEATRVTFRGTALLLDLEAALPVLQALPSKAP